MAVGVETLISVHEYLNTSYDPDVEYVDGILVRRNVGDWLHSLIQSNIIFHLRRKYAGISIVQGLRSQTRSIRYRLPDLCVLLQPPTTKFLVDAAFLTIEILSEDDRMSRMMEKLEEYDQKGIPHTWLIDPRLQKVSLYSSGTLNEVRNPVLATADPRLELSREEIFQS